MTEIKSHEFDANVTKLVKSQRIFVFYGPDRGLVSERAAQVAALTGIPLDDPFSIVRIEASDLQGNPARLVEETRSLGLFGGERLVWLRGSGTEKPLVDALNIISSEPLEGCFLIVEAGDVKKGAGLRKTAETARSVVAVACYTDDTRAINGLIDSELSQTGQRLTPAARDYLVSCLGGDRLASRNELRKLLLYSRGREQIDLEHVTEIIGDASSISVDDAVDAVLRGKRDEFLHAAQKVIASKTPAFMLLQSCMRQFQQMDTMRTEMEDKRLQPAQVMQTLGRSIHFRRKPAVERALRVWTTADLARETARLQAAVLQSRQRPALEVEIALQTLLSTTLQAVKRLN